MLLHDLSLAVALLFILEGIYPFVWPSGLRRALLTMSRLSDSELRFAGLTSMILGVLLLSVLRWIQS